VAVDLRGCVVCGLIQMETSVGIADTGECDDGGKFAWVCGV
jgi:hypothetical protein